LSAGADDGGALHILSMIGGDGSGIQRVSSYTHSSSRVFPCHFPSESRP
jgi:hypothetical protein